MATGMKWAVMLSLAFVLAAFGVVEADGKQISWSPWHFHGVIVVMSAQNGP